MEKLKYDSLYKFLVSSGVILISLPIIAWIYFMNSEAVLLSQEEYAGLSEYSLGLLQRQALMKNITFWVLVVLSFHLFVGGTILLIFGIVKWSKVQRNLDESSQMDVKIKQLELQKMSGAEILEKANQEAEEIADNTNKKEEKNKNEKPKEETPAVQSPARNAQWTSMAKYMEIEEKVFQYFASSKHYRRLYSFKRNVKIGNRGYDIIAVSQTDNVDYLIEVKYWRNPISPSRSKEVISYLFKSGENYENHAHRNFQCILAIVTPKRNKDRLKQLLSPWVEEIGEGKITLMIISEEELYGGKDDTE